MTAKTFAALALLLMSSAPMAAQELPWCVKLDVFTRNCAFATYQECVGVARDAASPATGAAGAPSCIRNPNYHPPAASAQAKPGPAKPPQR